MRPGSLVHAVARSVADPSVPDRELLACFADTGDAGAFELIVRRHADLVWRVCWGELPGDPHAAEDAFQATFLVLARKASAVREPSAAGFLFRVARNAAARVRKRIGTVRAPLAEPSADPSPVPLPSEDRAAVAAEVANLPDKFRLPVLLCFYEDCTHAEAAERLGWAVGTVASRLARAKDRLRERLTRKGFALPAVLAGGASADAVRAALAATAIPSAVPAGVSQLTREVLTSMRNAKLKLATGGVLAVLLAGGFGLSLLTAGPTPEEPKPKEQPKAKLPEKETPEQAELKKMQGTWRVTRLIGDPGEAPAEKLEPMRWEIVGDTLTIRGFYPGEERDEVMRVTVDPTKSPKQIGMTVVTGPDAVKGKTMPGIYELKDNKLRLCVGEIGQEHPKEFNVVKKQKGGLVELERIPDAIKSLKDLAGGWRVVSMVKDGKDVKPTGTLEIYRDVAWAEDGEKTEKLVVELDAANGFLDLTAITGPLAVRGKTIRGRFTWKDDQLTITAGEFGADRPADVNNGKGVTVTVLERGGKK